MTAVQIGGIEDHIHVLLNAPPSMAPSKAVQLLKGGASKWIHETFSNMRDFAWQDGFSAFTVSTSAVPDVTKYIRNQREHHRTTTFQEEYLRFLKRHGVKYDERYVWG